MKKILIYLPMLLLFCSAYAQQNPETDNAGPIVNVQLAHKIYPVHPQFLGTNFLYWIDDDAALADGNIVARLKEAHIKLLRYPGGTVADNYHWETNTLENTNMFPYESGAAETDFDEFMAACKKIGAEPSCVLNTETWAIKKDNAGGAHEACEWLRYCKTKGYQVKYWEIGNETYWHPILSATEYADLVNIYADSLKKIDPTIILGVNGHWNVEFTGTKERFKKGAYPEMMRLRTNITSKETYNAYTKFVEDNTELPNTKGDTKWWETIARRCGHNVDMIIVHWYFGANQLPIVTKKLSEVKNLFSNMYPDKQYLLNMSEYNVLALNATSHLELTEMIGAMLNGKTDLSQLWPMRLKYKKPTMLDFKTGEPSMIYQIYKQLAVNLNGYIVNTSFNKVPAYATYNGTTATVVLTGRKIDKPTQITVNVKEGKHKFTSCAVWQITGSQLDYKIKEEKLAFTAGSAVINMSPLDVAVIVFK